MYRPERKTLSQNFLKSPRLVRELLDLSSVSKNDVVLEIGPGRGIITEALLEARAHVFAVELDGKLVPYLREKFRMAGDRFRLTHGDAMKYRLPQVPYKVFANIPFSVEVAIVKKLLDAPLPPEEVCVIVRKDMAERFAATRKESLYSMRYRPWFRCTVPHTLHPYDYEPAARMETALLRIEALPEPLLPLEDRQGFGRFIDKGYNGVKTAQKNLEGVLSYIQFKKLGARYGIHLKAFPAELSIDQWVALYAFAKTIGKT
jgi:23S rRNA (adenine-N6)-dimethyltransferase